MIRREGDLFVLNTKHTTYAFHVLPSGHLEHLYYGRLIHIASADPLREKRVFAPGNCNAYDTRFGDMTLEDIKLEMSSYGKGDRREAFVDLIHQDGSRTCDFLFVEAKIEKGKPELETMPSSYGSEDEVWHLCVVLADQNQPGLYLEMHYAVYEETDVITRWSKLLNASSEGVNVQALMSQQLDLNPGKYIWTTFGGSWARECRRKDQPLVYGQYVNCSRNGYTSSHNQSFVMLHHEGTTEYHGGCYGFHLVYSGNHYEAAEVSSYGKVRVISGVNPEAFSWQLYPSMKEGYKAYKDIKKLPQTSVLEAPEAIMTFSDGGFNGMSQNMHDFIRQHISHGYWKDRERPILLNSWEAAYFDISEEKLLTLAKAGKEVGIELFVMDDGWFGERNDATTSLGDWYANKAKLPEGVEGICKKVNDLGLDFGIWIEPEMVSVNSELYKKHPEWAMEIPGKAHSEGRNQRVLDLGQTEVQDYIIDTMTRLLSSCPIAYVKWDMNRTFTDCYSQALPASRQAEVAHRYVLGLYRCLKTITERFPKVLFEGCAAGGGRFDPAVLCYYSQIWASDNTDAYCRELTQEGYSYGYPPSVYTCHVSDCPNHQTLRVTPLETRFHVACYGILGYECQLNALSKEDVEIIKQQIRFYKKFRRIFQFGRFYRNNPADVQTEPLRQWTCVSRDQKKAIGTCMQTLVEANSQYGIYQAAGLLEEGLYHFYNRNTVYSDESLEPVQHVIAPVKKDTEVEDMYVYGDTLMYHGVLMKQGFSGTGYTKDVRIFQDFASRMYVMEL